MRYQKVVLTSIFLAGSFVAGQASAVAIDLTGDSWDIENSSDESGTTWNKSTLNFTSQTPNTAGSTDSLGGYFDWQSSDGSFGREVFTGTIAPDLSLSLTGQSFDDAEPRNDLVLSEYSATLQEDGESILNGTWSELNNGIPGDWEAFRVNKDNGDDSGPLIIDPQLLYASYLGGSGVDFGGDMAIDDAGNIYVIGATTSIDFPTTAGAIKTSAEDLDVFVTKISPAGKIIYSTLFGGTAPGLSGAAIAVNDSGNAYITGQTSSPGLATPGAFQTEFQGGPAAPAGPAGADGFVAKLSQKGDRVVYFTYLGGTESDLPTSLEIDRNGNAIITGSTQSPDFPVANAYQPSRHGPDDAFVAKLKPGGGQVVYSTYLGGSNFELGREVTIDKSGNAYIAGLTYSANFPVTSNAVQLTNHGGEDATITMLDSAGALVYSTYLGGDERDVAWGIDTDSSGSIYVAGDTGSTDFPVHNAAQPSNAGGDDDVFVAKLRRASRQPAYSTYLGGSGDDTAFGGVAVDSTGSAYIGGATNSDNFPSLMVFRRSLRAVTPMRF